MSTFGHRLIRSASGGTPITPAHYAWSHQWRMVDAVGSQAPDTGTIGGATLTLSAGTLVTEGWACSTDVDCAYVDLDDIGGAIYNDNQSSYSLLVAVTPKAPLKFGRLIAARDASSSRPVDTRFSSTHLIYRGSYGAPVEYSLGVSTPFAVDQQFYFAILQDTATGYRAADIYILNPDGDIYTSYITAQGFESFWASSSTIYLQFLSYVVGDSTYTNGELNWAGYVQQLLTIDQIQAQVVAGRPPAP